MHLGGKVTPQSKSRFHVFIEQKVPSFRSFLGIFCMKCPWCSGRHWEDYALAGAAIYLLL
jgi:hypothetical protein